MSVDNKHTLQSIKYYLKYKYKQKFKKFISAIKYKNIIIKINDSVSLTIPETNHKETHNVRISNIIKTQDEQIFIRFNGYWKAREIDGCFGGLFDTAQLRTNDLCLDDDVFEISPVELIHQKINVNFNGKNNKGNEFQCLYNFYPRKDIGVTAIYDFAKLAHDYPSSLSETTNGEQSNDDDIDEKKRQYRVLFFQLRSNILYTKNKTHYHKIRYGSYVRDIALFTLFDFVKNTKNNKYGRIMQIYQGIKQQKNQNVQLNIVILK